MYDFVFCCHLKRGNGQGASIGSYGDDYDIVHYLTQTAEGEKDAALAVFKADVLESVTSEQYQFKNPENKQDALVAVYVIEDYFEY